MEILNWRFRGAALILAAGLMAGGASAQDKLADREAAAARYMRMIPVESMIDTMFAEISKQVPAEQRAQVLKQMKSVLRVDFLEHLMKKSMVKVFTADEINAIADFYSSKHGVSAMQKMGTYMAIVMPELQAEIQRAVAELSTKQKR